MPRYSLSVGDRTLRGERFRKFDPARARAAKLAVARQTPITILCDGIATTLVDSYGGTGGASYRLRVGSRLRARLFSATSIEAEAMRLAESGKTVAICDEAGEVLARVVAS